MPATRFSLSRRLEISPYLSGTTQPAKPATVQWSGSAGCLFFSSGQLIRYRHRLLN